LARDRKPALRAATIGIAVIALFAFFVRIADAQTAQARTPVLVELFTSEGCSSCPPADALAARLSAEQPVDGANIIILGEHVDYWDKDGWHDRFSSAQLTERQREYGVRLKVPDIYTPQLVIDGTRQFVGSDAPHILSAIAQDARQTTLTLTLSKPILDGDRVSASVSTPPGPHLKGDLYAALVDSSDTTQVLKGENKGRDLHHANVVRTLERIGSLKDLRSGSRSFAIKTPKDSAPANMRLIVFAQQGETGPVLGAASAPLTQ
jgi:hypothetical protein